MFLKRRCARCWSRPLIAMSLWLTLVPAAPAQAPAPAARSAAAARDWAPLDRIMGRPGKLQPGGVYKYGFPRADLHVRLDGVALRPAFALTSWVAFEARAADTMAMGDVVLSEAEVTPVLTKVEEMGMEVTALHNHVLRESPRVMYLHIEAEGRASEIARGLRAALALTGTPPASPPGTPSQPPPQLDTTAVKEALGYAGMVNGGVYQVSVPRAEPARAEGMEIPPAMGVATAINFQPTGDGKAAITGDFVLTADEVNPVLRTLEEQGITVTALHSHMLTEEPRLLFMHFWANDDAMRLAHGLRLALEHTKSKPPTP